MSSTTTETTDALQRGLEWLAKERRNTRYAIGITRGEVIVRDLCEALEEAQRKAPEWIPGPMTRPGHYWVQYSDGEVLVAKASTLFELSSLNSRSGSPAAHMPIEAPASYVAPDPVAMEIAEIQRSMAEIEDYRLAEGVEPYESSFRTAYETLRKRLAVLRGSEA
jgi:hypothetical protein